MAIIVFSFRKPVLNHVYLYKIIYFVLGHCASKKERSTFTLKLFIKFLLFYRYIIIKEYIFLVLVIIQNLPML